MFLAYSDLNFDNSNVTNDLAKVSLYSFNFPVGQKIWKLDEMYMQHICSYYIAYILIVNLINKYNYKLYIHLYCIHKTSKLHTVNKSDGHSLLLSSLFLCLFQRCVIDLVIDYHFFKSNRNRNRIIFQKWNRNRNRNRLKNFRVIRL